MPVERSYRPANPFHPHARRHRALQAGGAVTCMILGLTAAFFHTQVLRSDDLRLQAEDNQFRVVPISAPRGTIFDRDGQVIAETVSGWTLSVEPGTPEQVRERVERVAAVLAMDSAAVDAAVERSHRSRSEPVPLAADLTFDQVSRLEEQRGRMQGLLLEARPVRRYPAGPAVAHVVGYVAEIDDRELRSPAFAGYRAGQHVGKGGVERQFESVLGGTPGARFVEVDARGRLVGRFASQHFESPEEGGDVHLTLDLDLQRYAHDIFPEGMRGAVVALVPGTGEILAMYSAPTYDPNLLVGGIPVAVWRQLNGDPGRPLLNRVTHGIYPPGSTWKLATAIVGLERGTITPEEVLPIPCTGGMAYAGRYSRCWKREGHGPQDLIRAIANSCNVYFYQLGIKLGLENLAREGTRLGFSRPTGVDLPGESRGTFPSGRDWYVRHFGWNPTPSEVMSLSIGQGPNSQTPLRMAQFFSALAGDGTARAPHLHRDARPAVETDLRVSPQTLRALHLGMARVIESGGTAHAVELRRWKLYGKTGTAQNAQDLRRPHAWFTGFAGPRDGTPEIAVAVVVEFGESGSGAAAPIAARIAEYYLNKKHDVPNPPLSPETAYTARVGPRTAPAPRDTGRPGT